MTLVEGSPQAAATRRERGPLAVLGILSVALAVAVAVLLLRWPDTEATPPGGDSAAAGFARDMQIHHAQAVDLSMIVRDRTSDAPTRTLAYDIALTQQNQIGQMAGWLSVWSLRQAGAEPTMAWMGSQHSMPGMDMSTGMPGMATAADLERLGKESGREAELDFLKLMIAHHRGGVEMAQAVIARTDVPVVRDLAQKMIAGQQSEIELMNDMIEKRGGKPV